MDISKEIAVVLVGSLFAFLVALMMYQQGFFIHRATSEEDSRLRRRSELAQEYGRNLDRLRVLTQAKLELVSTEPALRPQAQEKIDQTFNSLASEIIRTLTGVESSHQADRID